MKPLSDALSELLQAVRLNGALFFNGEFSAPWCLRAPHGSAVAAVFAPEAKHLIVYHLVTEGHAFARLSDGMQENLVSGDVIVFPHGDEHTIGNGFPERPLDSSRVLAKHFSGNLKLVRFGGGGEATRIVCGYMTCDPKLSAILLAGLPNMIRVSLGDGPENQWLRDSIRFTAAGLSDHETGGKLIVTKLSEVLFVETLRRYIRALPEQQTGWLAGARDPVVGQALAMLHREPARDWTVEEIATGVGASRTRLAARFTQFLGLSPIAYLAQWRLKLAADLLQSSNDGVAEVAAAVGYGSEAAFNRAFKREFHCPPAAFRRNTRKTLE